jgi:hypothetical protein
MPKIQWFALTALLLFAGCFHSTREPDCLLDGTCECKAKSDCSAEKDCVDGKCVVIADAGIGELGWPCTDDAICLSKTCLPKGPGNGNVCTVACDVDAGYTCPHGWDCKSGRGGFFCNPPIQTACQACTADQDCNSLGDRCLTIGGGSFCAKDCSVTGGCPSSFSCRSLMTDAGVARQCIPDQNSCECSVVTAGLKRSCKKSAPLGTCYGFETCSAAGTWSGCDARDASVEVCDGLDNDCNGLTDGQDPGLVTSGVPNYPDCRKGLTCTGKWYCGPQADGGASFQCSAPDPKEEVCNGADDDCNGVIDDGLLDAMGNYVSPRACGSCATDCYQTIQHLENDAGTVTTGAATCEVRNGKRTCVPQRCAKGFFPSPSASGADICQQAVSSQCRPCTITDDCQVPGDQCVTVGTDPGKFCAQSCDPSSPYAGCTGKLGEQDCCPTDSTCESVNGSKLCVPRGDSCQCNSSRTGFSRSCFVKTATSTCVGQQACDPAGSFGVCDTSKTTVEFCNGLDDDCDGVVDNGFINTRGSGTYDTDEDCGACQNNCKAKWSPTIQHAVGGCRLGVGRVPGCSIVSCTTQSVGGGGQCHTSADCSNGRTCDPTYHQCVKTCAAVGDCAMGEQCASGFCTRACMTDAECQSSYGAPSSCTGGVCGVSYQFVNADNEQTNGCECAASSTTDAPDLSSTYPTPGLAAIDANCDGVDGTAATALFVWAQSPSSLGTRASPYKTIAEAITAFRPGVHSAILVAQGTYVEQVVMKDGVSLYGGYSSSFLSRDVVLFPTLIEAAEPSAAGPRGTVNAENLGSRTVLAGFTVRGYDVISRAAPGATARNSFGVYVKASPGLVVQNNHLVGGRGGDASPALPGVAGVNGGSGNDGVPTRECATPTCTNETQAGGLSGSNPSCANGTSGNPGAGSDLRANPQAYGNAFNGNGVGGSNATYQHSDPSQSAFCKYDCTVPMNGMSGGAALNGGDGAASGPGAPCSTALGAVAGDDWSGSPAGSGAIGTPGKGGGGGGAGGCVDNQNPSTCTVGHRVGDLGATGGGGGAGGCGGGAGIGAAGGGASFAIFVVGGMPAIDGNLVDLGFGGNGGAGGAGGYGGLGGQGGRGGAQTTLAWCAGIGGPGGRGGNGGAGSGGGGGCGGSVFGIAGQAIGGANFATRNTLAPAPMNAAGLGGVGGASPAGVAFKGGDGTTGVVAPVQSF